MGTHPRHTVAAALLSGLLLLIPVNLAGEVGAPPPASPYVLTLGEQRFDPLDGVPPAPPALAAGRFEGADLRLVQLTGPPQAADLDALRAAGLEIVQYIHPYTYIVWGQSSQLDAIGRTANVRWTGDFAPVYRLLPAHRNLPADDLAVRVLLVRAANTDALVGHIAALGARVRGRRALDRRFELVVGDVSGGKLADIARLPGVYSVQPVPTDGGLRGEMSDQVCVNNLDADGYAFPGYPDWLATTGLSGAGVLIANVDGGIQDDHPDLVNRLLPCSGVTCGGTGASSHGTHTAGIMAADGGSAVLDSFGFLRGLGIAPGASLVEQVYSPFYTQPDGMLLLMTDSQANGASLSGNSWGPSGTPQGYDSDTLQVDIGVRDADPNTPGNQPLTFVLSIMNGYGGTSSQGTPDEAKNIFTIGSTKMQLSTGEQILQINDLSGNTAHGPALDGRHIPHLVAPGCRVDSSDWGSSHALKCGTSMASPHVSGAVALFIEYYRTLPEYTTDPSPALIKAAFLPVAHDLAGHLDADGGILGHPFDDKQGWGRLNLPAVVAPDVPVRYWDQQVVLDDTGQEWVQDVSAADPGLPVKLMLVWTDAPGHGLGGSTPAWNNDLDLVVETEGGTCVGNNFGPDGWSVTGAAADFMNNTEGVFLAPPVTGSCTLRVVASNINSDGVPNFGDDTDQDFALVCYNCALEPGFTVAVEPAEADLCVPGQVTLAVTVNSIMGFDDPVTLSVVDLPAGSTTEFSPNPVTPPGTATLTLEATTAAAGEYAVQVVGQSGQMGRAANLRLRVLGGIPEAVVLDTPADGAADVALRPAFGWAPADGGQTYDIEIAADAAFVEVVESATGLTDTTFTPPADLASGSEFFWRVRAVNICGAGAFSPTFRFTTRTIPTILLVDDDDNLPDVRTFYTDALTALSLDFDVWDTENSDNEPSAAQLEPYTTVIWFTGDEFGGAAGPGAAGEAALAEFLDAGKNLLISSQDYYYDRGMTTLMSERLGVAAVMNDVSQTTVTGAGTVLAGRGPFALAYPFANFSDRVSPGDGAELAMLGDQGDAGVDKDDPVYRTMFWGFPFEALPTADERTETLGAILAWFRPYLDCNANGVADHVDIYLGTSEDLDGNGVPDECEAPPLCAGDLNCDGVVDYADINPFVLALAGPTEWPDPNCPWLNGDCNGDENVTYEDIDAFVTRIGATCP